MDAVTIAKKYLYEFEFTDLRHLYPQTQKIENYYLGKTLPTVTKRIEINEDETVVGFTLPPHILNMSEDNFWLIIDDTFLKIKYLEDMVTNYKKNIYNDDEYKTHVINDRVYIYGNKINEDFDKEIKLFWFGDLTHSSTEPYTNEDHIELELPFGKIYLKGKFLDVSNKEDKIVNTNYVFSKTVVGLKDGFFYSDTCNRKNAHTIKLTKENKEADKLYVLVTDEESYYKDILKHLKNEDVLNNIPQRNISQNIKNELDKDTLDSIDGENLLETIKEDEYGLYQVIDNRLNGKKINTFDLSIKELTFRSGIHYFEKGTKLDFYKPKFEFKLLNSKCKDIEIFINGKLYYDERAIIQKGRYTYIYLGPDKIFKEYIDHNEFYHQEPYHTYEDIIEKTKDLLNENDIKITFVLKEDSYTWENFSFISGFKGHLFLPDYFPELYDVRVYRNGYLLNMDKDYMVKELLDETYGLFFKIEVEDDDIFTITGHKDNVGVTVENISPDEYLEGEKAFYKNEYYYKGRFITQDTHNISTNVKILNLDFDDEDTIKIYKKLDKNIDEVYDYRDELIDINELKLPERKLKSYADKDYSSLNEEHLKSYLFYVKYLEPEVFGFKPNEEIPNDIIEDINENYSSFLDEDGNIDISLIELPDSTYREIPHEKFLKYMVMTKYLYNEELNEDELNYIENQLDKRNENLYINADALRYFESKYETELKR